MAQLDAEQIANVEELMTVAMNGLRMEVMSITGEGRTTFAEAQDFIRAHHAELHASADRVTQNVVIVNALAADFNQNFEEIKQNILAHDGAITAGAAGAQALND